MVATRNGKKKNTNSKKAASAASGGGINHDNNKKKTVGRCSGTTNKKKPPPKQPLQQDLAGAIVVPPWAGKWAVAVSSPRISENNLVLQSSSSPSPCSTTPSSVPLLQDIPRDVWCSTLIFYLDFHTDIPNLLKVYNRKLYQLIDHEDVYKSFAQNMYPSQSLPLVVLKTPTPKNGVKESNEHDDDDDDNDDDRKLPAVSFESPTTSLELLPSPRTQLVPENYQSWKECTMDHNSQNAVLVRRLVDRGFQARRRYKVLLRSTLMLDSIDDVVICKLEVDHELKRPLNQRGRSALIRTTYDALKHTKVVRTKTFRKEVIREYTETNLFDPIDVIQGSGNASSGSDKNDGLVEGRSKKRKRSNNSLASGLWSCHACTFQNEGYRVRCIMCGRTIRSNQRRRLQQQQPPQQPPREEKQDHRRSARSTSRTAKMHSAAAAPQRSAEASSLKAPPSSYNTPSSPTNVGVTATAGPLPSENMIASRTRSKVSSSASTNRKERRERKRTIEEEVVSTELKPIHKYLETLEQSSTSVRHVFLLVFKSSDFLPNSDYTLDYPFGRSPKVWLEKAQYQGPSLRHDLFSLSPASLKQQHKEQSPSLPILSVDPRTRTHGRREHPHHNVDAGQEIVAPLPPPPPQQQQQQQEQQQEQQAPAAGADVDNTRRTRNGNVSIGNSNNDDNERNDNANDNNASSNTNRLSLALSAVHNTGGRTAVMLPRDGTLHKSWRTRYLRGLRAEEDDDDGDSTMPDLEPVDEEGTFNDDRSDAAVAHRHADDIGDAAVRVAAAERQRERRPAAINIPVLRAAGGGVLEMRRRRRERRRQEQDAVGHVIAGVLGVAAAAAADAGDAEPRPGAGAAADDGGLINAANAAVFPERVADNAIADDAVGRVEQAGVRNRGVNAGRRIAAAVAEAAGIAQPPQRQPSQQGGGRGEGSDTDENNPNDNGDHDGDMVRYVVSSRLPPLRPLLHIGRGNEGARLFHVEPPPPSRVEQPQQDAAAAAGGNVRDNVRNNARELQLHGGGDAGGPNDLSNTILHTNSVDETESMDEHIMRPLGGGRIRVQRFDVQPDVHNFFRRAAAAAAGGVAVRPMAAGGAAGHVAANNPPPAEDAGDGNNMNRNGGANLPVNNAGRRGGRRMLLRIQLGHGGVAAIAADDEIRMAEQRNDQQEQAGQHGDAQADPVGALPRQQNAAAVLPRQQNAAAGWRQPGDDGAELMIPGALANLIPNMARPLLIRAGNPANNNNNDRRGQGQNRQDEVGARIRRNLPARAAARGARRRVARILGGPMAEARETALQRLRRHQSRVDNAHHGSERSIGGNQESLQGLGVNPGRSDRDERARRRNLRNRRVELERRRDEQRERIREIEQNVERERQRNRRLRVRLAELQAQVRLLEEFRNGRGNQDQQQQQQQHQNPPPPPPPPL